jgi:polar amino acid transport system substrate-binding protein
MKIFTTVLPGSVWLILYLFLGSLGFAQETIRVAIKPLTPFVMKTPTGFEGYSIDLWNSIAARNTWRTQYKLYYSVQDVLDAVKNGQADIGIAGISITKEREQQVDFSVPMFNSGLQVIVPVKSAFNPLDGLKNFFSPQLGFVALIIVLVVLLAGHVMWLTQRNNPNYPKGYVRGVTEGIWWASMSFAQTSLGEQNPISVLGRLMGVFWVIASVVLLANFTASVTANLTVQQIQGNIRGINDLPGKKVLTIKGTTAEMYLAQNAINFKTDISIENALAQLEAGKVDAVVYDAPVLQYMATRSVIKLNVVGDIFKPEYYGIAMPIGSARRKIINQIMIDLITKGELTKIQQSWFGKN